MEITDNLGPSSVTHTFSTFFAYTCTTVTRSLLKPWALMVVRHLKKYSGIYVMAMEEKNCQENYNLHHAN